MSPVLCTIVCTAQHRRTCLTACGRQRSSLVAVSALLTLRHCRRRRLVGLPWATAPFRWLQRGYGLPPETRAYSSLLTFRRETKSHLFVSHTADLALSILFRPSADVCVELYNSFRYKLCKVPPQLCDGSTIILTFVVAVAVV